MTYSSSAYSAGEYSAMPGYEWREIKCTNCHGTGKIIATMENKNCAKCKGDGTITMMSRKADCRD